jgi:hypothetical protein
MKAKAAQRKANIRTGFGQKLTANMEMAQPKEAEEIT